MQSIGEYFDRQVYWLDYENFSDQLPEKDWICLAIANQQPDLGNFDLFVRTSISKGILEFKGHGKFGEKLHDIFDETIIFMEVMENHSEINVVTTWHNNETLADTFWQCFFVTCLPERNDLNNIKIICTDLDGVNKTEELKVYIKEFGLGWLPSENVKHEVWQNEEGLTTLCMADERGDACRKILDPSSKLIYEFYAGSHFEAMAFYYKFMDWGEYTTEFEIDKQPYERKNAP